MSLWAAVRWLFTTKKSKGVGEEIVRWACRVLYSKGMHFMLGGTVNFVRFGVITSGRRSSLMIYYVNKKNFHWGCELKHITYLAIMQTWLTECGFNPYFSTNAVCCD